MFAAKLGRKVLTFLTEALLILIVFINVIVAVFIAASFVVLLGWVIYYLDEYIHKSKKNDKKIQR